MLSYRHAFHAGNNADILKHAVLSLIAIHMKQKEKPFSYLDSHAGAGSYSLDTDWAKMTGEAERGILAIMERDDVPETLKPYIAICREFYRNGHRYPGSPAIVQALARPSDRLTLMELHPTEIENLRSNMAGDPRLHIHHRDGYQGLMALCPPEPRRGFALIDPSYETSDDFTRTAETLIALHRRWSAGILVLWYPLLQRRSGEILALKDRFYTSEIPGVLTAELIVDTPEKAHVLPECSENPQEETENATGYGLYGSGMLVIGPPWKLDADLEEILPWLARVLGKDGNGSWNLEWINRAE